MAAAITTTTITIPTSRAAWRSRPAVTGARAMAPWLVGIVPYGLIIGVSAAQASVPTGAGWLTGLVVYGGAAQMAVIDLLDAAAAPVVVIGTAVAINLRLVLYSAAMAPHWQGTPRWWRALAAYLLVDPSFAVGADGYEAAGDRRSGHLHYLGGAVVLWVAWIAAITAGATAGAALPPALSLEFVIPLFLVGQVTCRATTRPARRAIATAVIVGGAVAGAPLGLGPLLAMGAAVAVGLRTKEHGT